MKRTHFPNKAIGFHAYPFDNSFSYALDGLELPLLAGSIFQDRKRVRVESPAFEDSIKWIDHIELFLFRVVSYDNRLFVILNEFVDSKEGNVSPSW